MKIRKLYKTDLPLRVDWVNDVRVHRSMHFQIPISLEGTICWFDNNRFNKQRIDFVFEQNGTACAMGGFTDIVDYPEKSGELYIFVDPEMHGKGIGKSSTSLLCEYAFSHLHFDNVYLYTNADNYTAQKLYESIGFILGERIKNATTNGDDMVIDRLRYDLKIEDFKPCDEMYLKVEHLYLDEKRISFVRDDLFPFVGGGSKARKAMEYEFYLRDSDYNAVVTCGGIQSNHNRAIAIMAAKNGWKCHLCIQGTQDRFLSEKGNALLDRLSGAECETIMPEDTAVAMNNAMEKFKTEGLNPYYIHGGGHDLPGGTAFVKAVQSLYRICVKTNYKPDYIFLASGTGSTQAGIVVGLELVGWNDVKVVGISVARQQERGRQVVADFANMLGDYYNIQKDFTSDIIFCADYLCGGYEQYTPDIENCLSFVMRETGIMFDTTYSGKAFYGMMDYIKKNGLQDKNILFWHTGGLMNIMK
ncbi:MAG: pyridoxal-phosphate dependent enzyme [Muribaculaceae bacterium]|nr:pyridoxal-phosphate dependent enzyme [Muribaculaceae bacterium]